MLRPGACLGLRRVAPLPGTSAGKGHEPGGVIRIPRPLGREPLEILISPLPYRHDEWLASRPPVGAIFVTDRECATVSEDSVLVRLHGLTPTEAKIAVALLRGRYSKEICRDLDISYNTLKTHLKHIYAKTHTTRQSDLVRFLATGLRVSGADGSK